MRAALQLASDGRGAHPDLARLRRETLPLTRLHGTGTAAVRAAARQLVVALELLEQQQRRHDAEVLRVEPTHLADPECVGGP